MVSNIILDIPHDIWGNIVDMSKKTIDEKLEELEIKDLESLHTKLKKIKIIKYNELRNKKYKRYTIIKDKYERYWIIYNKKEINTLRVYRMEYSPDMGMHGNYHIPTISNMHYISTGILDMSKNKIIINKEVLDFEIVQYQDELIKKMEEIASTINIGDQFGIYSDIIPRHYIAYMNDTNLLVDGGTISAEHVRVATKITKKHIYCHAVDNLGGYEIFNKSSCFPIN